MTRIETVKNRKTENIGGGGGYRAPFSLSFRHTTIKTSASFGVFSLFRFFFEKKEPYSGQIKFWKYNRNSIFWNAIFLDDFLHTKKKIDW